jgi:hypothetical protein
MVEADAAASEVAAMPAGTHVMLDQTRQAVERRANVLIAQLQELEGEPHVEAVPEEGAGCAAEDAELHSLGDAAGEREHPPAAEPRERLRKDFGTSKRLGHPGPFPREVRGLRTLCEA